MLVRTKVIHVRGFALGVLAPLSLACGSGGGSDGPPFGSSSTPSADAAPSRESGPSTAPARDAGSIGSGSTQSFGDSALATLDASVAPQALMGCAESTTRAQQVPVDLYFILDTSGSMSDLVAQGQSKWSAVVAALTTFVDDPASSGLGIGLQYFPVPAAGIPASCASDDDCESLGPCLLGVCDDADQEPCAADEDCEYPAACAAVGECANDPNNLCDTFGRSCGGDENGFDLGSCRGPLQTSYCADGDSCSPDDYAAAAVPIAVLPGTAAAVVASLTSRTPQGDTPTEAALQGAVRAASSYGAAHPGHTVVAVLATDGVPDEAADGAAGGACTATDPTTANADVSQIAATALAASPSVETFAIGVFTPDDVAEGTATLDRIAASGGTTSPFIVDTSSGSSGVEAQFITALAQIRGTSLPCEFALPASPSGGALDFGRVNVSTSSDGSAPATISYVESPGACDAAGGWSYDIDPAEGGTPAKIDLCPVTCSALRDDPDAVVDIVVGCETIPR